MFHVCIIALDCVLSGSDDHCRGTGWLRGVRLLRLLRERRVCLQGLHMLLLSGRLLRQRRVLHPLTRRLRDGRCCTGRAASAARPVLLAHRPACYHRDHDVAPLPCL